MRAQNLARFESEKEERGIVGNRSHVVVITLREAIRIIARDEIGKWIMNLGRTLRGQINRNKLGIVREMGLNGGFLLRRECCFLGQHDYRNAILVERTLRGDDKVLRRIGYAKGV